MATRIGTLLPRSLLHVFLPISSALNQRAVRACLVLLRGPALSLDLLRHAALLRLLPPRALLLQRDQLAVTRALSLVLAVAALARQVIIIPVRSQ